MIFITFLSHLVVKDKPSLLLCLLLFQLFPPAWPPVTEVQHWTAPQGLVCSGALFAPLTSCLCASFLQSQLHLRGSRLDCISEEPSTTRTSSFSGRTAQPGLFVSLFQTLCFQTLTLKPVLLHVCHTMATQGLHLHSAQYFHSFSSYARVMPDPISCDHTKECRTK